MRSARTRPGPLALLAATPAAKRGQARALRRRSAAGAPPRCGGLGGMPGG